MSEKTKVWQPLRDRLRGKWHALRIEAKIPKGIPDVLYHASRGRTGWLELKYSTTIAADGKVQSLNHFSIEQRKFLNQFPCTRLLWRIDDQWLLFDQEFDLIGHVPFKQLTEIAQYHWNGTPNWEVMASSLEISAPIS